MNCTNSISFPLSYPEEVAAGSNKRRTRRTKSLDDVDGHKLVKSNKKSEAQVSNKNVLSRVRNAFFSKRRSVSSKTAKSDLDSLQASLESIEAFLQVVQKTPEAKTLLEKELQRTMKKMPTAA